LKLKSANQHLQLVVVYLKKPLVFSMFCWPWILV